MKKVLYITNIEVPYRVEFFNQLSQQLDLTVLYERKKSSNRDGKWASSVKSNYKVKYLNGIKMKKEYSFDLGILKYVLSKKYQKIVFGCINSPSQILAILLMRLLKKEYVLNLDGEYFFEGKGLKKSIKRFLVKGASDYLIAGEKPAEKLTRYVSSEKIHVYHFSSLTKKELENNSKKINIDTNNTIIVVGQYYDYKGLDIALEVAKESPNQKYRFIGSGKRSEKLKNTVEKLHLSNVEVIPFLQKEELFKEFQNCKSLLLTSRNECWGLVVNEALSFGCPIIASSGCGAAEEMLSSVSPDFLVNNNSIEDYLEIINKKVFNTKLKDNLIKKNRTYSIERSVEETAKVLSD